MTIKNDSREFSFGLVQIIFIYLNNLDYFQNISYYFLSGNLLSKGQIDKSEKN